MTQLCNSISMQPRCWKSPNDPASMFSHMRNCHEAHNKLLHHSTMVTEFLGALPMAAMQAVAKYDPYIAPVLVGLRAYSSGGYA